VVPALAPTLPRRTGEPWVFSAGGWPRVNSILLTIKESPTANVTYAPGAEAFTIGLPPATIYTVRLSSTPTPALIKSTAVWNELGGNVLAELAALEGMNWMLSPYRELLLIHAVQQPLLIPSLVKPYLTREVGWSYVLVNGGVKNDGRSTVHIDLNASWIDPYDDVNDPKGPHVLPDKFTEHQGLAFELPVNYADTVTPIGGVVGQTDAVFERGGIRHDFGDTKHRWVTYQPNAASRYREYFPPSITADPANITTPGVKQILNVLSSKRPVPLEILYAVPTWQWTTSADGLTKTRAGRGIRIYLERPWFTTGADEMVGVCLLPTTMMDSALSKYTSEWGRDPVWTSTGVTEPLQPEHFVNRILETPEPPAFNPTPPALSTGPYALAEDNTLSVGVVGFFPEYDPDRALWYVDILMDPGDSYFPLVRLALARFQPHSVGFGSVLSQHLSRVTRTEFIQLVPDRVATITQPIDRVLQVTVSGVAGFNSFATATEPSSAITAASAHVVSAQVQSRPAGSTNDLLWTNVGGGVVLSPDLIGAPDVVTWMSRMQLPVGESTLEYRVLIKEVERYQTDSDVEDGSVVSAIPASRANSVPYGQRLVYACGIPLKL
jgi:hypothetical protein